MALYFILRRLGAPAALASGTYTRAYHVDASRILTSLSTWTAWLFRDFPYLFPLVIFVIWSVRRKEQQQTRMLADPLLWMAGWVAVFLPWQSTLEYYLLPFAAGCAIFCGVAAGDLVTRLRQQDHPRWLNMLALVAVLLLAVTRLNNVTAARFQLSVDGSNSDLLGFLARLPRRSTVLINLPEPNEYVSEIGVHLAEFRGLPDLAVDYFRLQVPAPGYSALTYYVATPVLENQTAPTPRHAVYESGANTWAEGLDAFAGRRATLVYAGTRSMHLLDFGLQQFLCPFIYGGGISGFIPRPLVDTRQLTEGWRVYRISSDARSMDLPGSFRPDGTWVFLMPSGLTRDLRFGQNGDIPITGDWDGDGRAEIGVFRPSTLTWYLDRNLDGQSDLEYRFPGMQPGDLPVAGDWDGDGKTTPGYFRPSDASWHLRNSCVDRDEDWPVVRLGLPGDIPLAGDWDGDGRSSIGIYRRTTGEVSLLRHLGGVPELITMNVGVNSALVVGDWSGLGVQSVASVAGGAWRLWPNCNCSPSNLPAPITFATDEGVPLAGKRRRQQTHS